MMKIVALIPLILEINNSVGFLNLILNMEEHNLEFVEEQIQIQICGNYHSIKISSLNFHAQLETSVSFNVIKILIIVY